MLQNLAVVFIWFHIIWHWFHLITACDPQCPYWKLHYNIVISLQLIKINEKKKKKKATFSAEDTGSQKWNWELSSLLSKSKETTDTLIKRKKGEWIFGKEKKSNPHLHLLYLFITSLTQLWKIRHCYYCFRDEKNETWNDWTICPKLYSC